MALAVALGACSGPIETRVSSVGPGVPQPAAILLEAADPVAPASEARQAVLSLLARRGFAVEQNGALQLQVALSARDAAIGYAAGDRVIAAPKKKRPLQSCNDREIRLSVVLTDIKTGSVVYRSSAAEYHCKAQWRDVLPVLVERAIADLAAPKGAYIVRRNGLD